MRHVRFFGYGLVAAAFVAYLAAPRISNAAPPTVAQPVGPVGLSPALAAARLAPPSRAAHAARLQALGLDKADPALGTKLTALADYAATKVVPAPKTEYPGANGANFGASLVSVKVATPATIAALKSRVAVPAAEIPKQAHLVLIAGWPNPSTQFPFPEIAGLRLTQLGATPTAIIETTTCGTYEVQANPEQNPVSWDDFMNPTPSMSAPTQIPGLQVVRLQSFLSLVDSPQVAKLTLYGNGRFSDTTNIPLNPYPSATTPAFSEYITVSYDRQHNGVAQCSAPWMCGPSKIGLSPKSRVSSDDPCMVDPVNCTPPPIQGDDLLASFMLMMNGFRVTATVVGVDSYTDFNATPKPNVCYDGHDPCYADINNYCVYCYSAKGPHLPNDGYRSATIWQEPTARFGEIRVRWSHAVGESISYKVRFDFYGTGSAVYRATSYQPKQTACAGEQ